MVIDVKPGKYVVAVSGGVDSVVLLDVLSRNNNLELVVAHFDHGIRENSDEDRKFVEELAKQYGLEFVYERAELRSGASEEQARKARYEFLHTVREDRNADAIITAHHQDDVIETMMINLMRGTGRKGLSSLKSTKTLKRPLVELPKSEIKDYARTHQLRWREDKTNRDTSLLRNNIRQIIKSRLSEDDRQQWVRIYQTMCKTNKLIDQEITKLLQNRISIDRQWILTFPHKVACEIIAEFLRQNHVELSARRIQDATIFCKTGNPGNRYDLNKTARFRANKTGIALESNR